ncbi:Bbp16 family capsid cement protein [Cupriavidus metallidurans]|uniref:Bbp16 family capsid cement protein n=1 Tax=Cupriavidus metallidurans TaxID=119219 RepID=UPI0035C66A13
MILDIQEQFSSAQSIVSAAGDVVSTNIYDTGAAADVGIGEEIYLVTRLGAAVTSGGAATVQVVLQTADDAAFSANLTEFPQSSALALAALTANTEISKQRLPIGLRRYLRVVYRVGTAATTAGTVDAFLVKDVQANRPYASGFTVQ